MEPSKEPKAVPPAPPLLSRGGGWGWGAPRVGPLLGGRCTCSPGTQPTEGGSEAPFIDDARAGGDVGVGDS